MFKKNFLTIKGEVRKVVNKKVKEATLAAYRETMEYMEVQLLNHPLSEELFFESSPSSYFKKPKGTLFGLMGFKSSRNPVFELLSFLKGGNGLRYILSKDIDGGVFNALLGPSDKDLASGGIVLDGWGDGRAWPAIVEEGIPGLSNYFVSEYGRSEKGIQFKHSLNDVKDLNRIKYLSTIYRNTEKKFSKTIIRKLGS